MNIIKMCFVQSILYICLVNTAFCQIKISRPVGDFNKEPVKHLPSQIFLNSLSKKVGNNTTLTITKRSADWKPKASNNVVLSATNDEVNPSNVQQVCRTETHRYTAENLDQDIMNPNALGLIKLGGVYSLENMQSGNYNTITTNRAPINIYITNAAQRAKLVTNPDILSLQAALDYVRAIPYPVSPSSLGQFLESTQVTNTESLDMAAGLSYSGFGFNGNDKFQYDSKNTTNKFLLNYTAANYIAYAEPISSGALFTNPNQLNNFTPVYISQIVYGSRLLVYFEENVSQDEVKNGFSASYTGAIGSINASLDMDVQNRMKKTTFKIYLFGSNDQLFIETGLDAMLARVNTLLGQLSIGTKKSPLQMGQPISYQLKYMDGDIAVTSCKVEDIPQKICGPNPLMPLDLQVDMDGLNLEGGVMFGWLDAEVVNGNGGSISIKPVWIKDRNDDYWQSTIAVPSKPMVQMTFDKIDKPTRDFGALRIWYRVQNRDIGGTDVRLKYLNDNVVDRATNGLHGSWQGNFVDIPLNKIMAVKPGETQTNVITIQSGSKKMEMTFSSQFKY